MNYTIKLEKELPSRGCTATLYKQDQTTTNIMGAILKQLVVKGDEALYSARKVFPKAKKDCGGRRRNFRIILAC